MKKRRENVLRETGGGRVCIYSRKGGEYIEYNECYWKLDKITLEINWKGHYQFHLVKGIINMCTHAHMLPRGFLS